MSNLGHNPRRWMQRFVNYMGWTAADYLGSETGYFQAATMTAYNAITPLEAEASRRLVASLQSAAGGSRLQTVNWAASGSEAVQKALWACMRATLLDPAFWRLVSVFTARKGSAEP